MSISNHLQILGTGSAFGQTRLTAAELGKNFAAQAARYSVLGREYLFSTHNRDLRAVKQDGNQSPTDLAVLAAKAAAEDAGISISQLGLVIGDCSTPWQSTPSEGQRVADQLGLKVAAYDIAGGGISPLQLALLNRWKRDRVGEYTLLIAVATPTSRLVFAGSEQANGEQQHCWSQFSDAAFACVVSAKHRGKYSLLDADVKYTGTSATDAIPTVCGSKSSALSVSAYEPLSFNREGYIAICERLMDEHAGRAIFKNKLHGSHCFLAAGEVDVGTAQRIAERHDLVRFVSTFAEHGQLLNAGGLSAFSRLHGQLAAGDKVIVLDTAPGIISGYSVLMANN